ncbi:MFS general substrate transporter [Epithele typhae]|uniref:MFS general substrate transporter n=1 Tax=Epithele typhae TaxID=378194 RepID=UPI0020089246|nr:MFS general substrate transporter [Epithele typhae]KAH9923694.1 MFS general substrate transporter [Epithele typhae]
MSASNPSERDPLLPPLEDASKRPTRIGPLEISRSTRHGILAGIWAATFLSVLLPSISSDFNKAHQASWLGTSYLLATCTFTPLYGRLSNILGRRGANQTAVFFAGLGTIACGSRQTWRCSLQPDSYLAGLGGGGVFTTATIITSDMYSLRNRGLTQGVSAMGMGLGGPLGGFIADRLGWRWAFLIQLPMFLVSFMLTSTFLHYTTPNHNQGGSKSTKQVLKRIDYGGTLTLLGTVLSFLIFLSTRFSEEHPWSSPTVYVPLVLFVVFFVTFVVFELCIAPEPMLAPFLLRQRVPVLVGFSNFLVATCNFTVMYNFPTWFQTVLLTSASEAGAHLIPNGVSISLGSLFAGWIMHRTGRYRTLNLVFGLFPFVSAVLISLMREDSSPVILWLSIVLALLAHLPQDAMAVGTGFGQLFRGIGQVGGVAVSAALFQSLLTASLRARVPGALPPSTPASEIESTISRIRHSSTLVATLEPALQRAARDAYAEALRAVFVFAAVATLAAYIVRLPIPDRKLDAPEPRPRRRSLGELPNPHPADAEELAEETSPPGSPAPTVSPLAQDSAVASEAEDGDERADDVAPIPVPKRPTRRLSTYESSDGGMDLEDEVIGGSARR